MTWNCVASSIDSLLLKRTQTNACHYACLHCFTYTYIVSLLRRRQHSHFVEDVELWDQFDTTAGLHKGRKKPYSMDSHN